MELKGRIKELFFANHKTCISFEIDSFPAEIEEECSRLEDKDLKISISQHSPKRSLNANAYFHLLCREIGKAIDRSETFVKNRMIAIAGQPLILEDGERASIKTNLDLNQIWEQELLHAKPIGTKYEDRELYYYAIMRPSHEYSVKEMSQLIDATVEECKSLGIPTISDKDMERMLNAWGK